MFDPAANAAHPIVYVHRDKVRETEVDMHRGVASYWYLAMAQTCRHEYLRAAGLDIDAYIPVVIEAHAKYHRFLGPNDLYHIELRIRPERLGYTFLSDIINSHTGKLSHASALLIMFFRPDRTIVRRAIPEVGRIVAAGLDN